MSATEGVATWLERPGKMPLWKSVLVGAALLGLAGLLDWLTGPQIALALLYVVPVTWITWQAGRWLGLGMAGAASGVWLWAELAGHASYTSPFVPYWNGLTRLGLFCLISILQAEVLERKRVERGLRRTQEELEQRVQQRTAELRALNNSLEQQVAERSAAAEERAAKLVKSEAALQKQTNILESILSSMADGVMVADAQGRLIHINPAASRLLRIPAAQPDVMAWLQSQENYLPTSPAAPASRENPLLRAVRGEVVEGAEMFLRHASLPGGIWLSVNSRPLLDPAGQVTGGVILFSDVSTRKNLARELAEVSEREQRRLGEDLHDGLCQYLVGVAFAARKLAGRLAERSLPEAEEATQIAELLGQSIGQARAVARGLYLVPLETGGLRSALEEFLLQVQARHRVACQLVERVSVPILGELALRNLFRIAQEAVNNAIKHAQPSRIGVSLLADGQHIELAVEDDGRGFQPEAPQSRGMGLHLMNYRARMMGAALRIEPRPAGGTVVSCSLRRENLAELKPHGQSDENA